MGPREVVGIAMFAVALAITISLTFNETGLADDDLSRPVSLGQTPPTEFPALTPTPEAVPLFGEDVEVDWVTSYFSRRTGGEAVFEARDVSNELALELANAPLPEMHDDSWFVESRAELEAVAGRYRLMIETSGNMTVELNGAVFNQTGALPEPRTVEVVFNHAGGPLEIAITAEDKGGPFVLSVR